MSGLEPRTVTLHGRPVSYVKAGSGPLLLLIHGIAGSVENWHEVIEPLAQRHTVLAPSLPGHGRSAPGAGDYSLGALATGLRDLLVALGHERATLVGHSLGGGIAMQFAYQFPEITERLALVSSGGLGPEVSAILRAAALPGADLFIGVTAALGTTVGSKVARGLAVVGLRPSADVAEVARGYASLVDHDRRAAFLATLRGVVGTGGQRVSAGDRLLPRRGHARAHHLGRTRPNHPGPTRRERSRGDTWQPPGGFRERRPSAPTRGARTLHHSARAIHRRHSSRRRLMPSAGVAVSASPASSHRRSAGTPTALETTSRRPADGRAMADRPGTTGTAERSISPARPRMRSRRIGSRRRG